MKREPEGPRLRRVGRLSSQANVVLVVDREAAGSTRNKERKKKTAGAPMQKCAPFQAWLRSDPFTGSYSNIIAH